VEKKEFLYEGKAKKIYASDNDNVIIEFKDDLTAFNAEKKGSEKGKGALNNKITIEIFKLLEDKGIKTHFVKKIDDIHLLAKRLDIIMIEVIVRNVATGSFVKRFGVKDGTKIDTPLVEFCYKNDDLGDPFINDEHCKVLDLLQDDKEIEHLKNEARKINNILKPYFLERKLNLIDFKVEFGKTKDGEIVLADEITPDSCRFWDVDSNEKLDKDRFREDIGNVKVAYEEVLNRILNK
jgi:phosphoribosylaminoimidazole-succinocarboxamide synthase